MAKKIIPEFNHFNQSLDCLQLPLAPDGRSFHAFKWHYKKDFLIEYPSSRQSYFDITFFVKARFEHRLNTDTFDMVNHSLHLLTPGQVEQFKTTALKRAIGYGLYFLPNFLFSKGSEQYLKKDFPFLNHGNRNVFYLTLAQSLEVQQIFETLIKEAEVNNEDIIRQYILVLLYKLKYFTNERTAIKKGKDVSKNSLVFRFQEMSNLHYLEHLKVNTYAKRLNVTPRRLCEEVKKETGKTPKESLNEMILMEAKLLLLHSSMTVSEIAWHLNFHDVPHFTNFFANNLDLTPQQFRKANKS